MREFIEIAARLGGDDDGHQPATPGLLMEYVEAQTYRMILREDARADFLMKTYGEKLAAKLDTDTMPPETRAEIASQPAETPAAKLISYLSTLDPTPRKNYTQWLVVRYLGGGILLEDAERIIDLLTAFDRVKARLTQRDINGYKTLGALQTAVEPFTTNVATAAKAAIPPEAEEKIGQRMLETDQTKMLYNGADMMVVMPLTIDSAAYWGRDTIWCTTWGHPWSSYPERGSQYAYYTQRGPLYVIIDKTDGGAKYQFHFEKGGRDSLMDARDDTINIGEFIHKHPTLLKIIGEKNFEKQINKIGLSYFSPAMIERMNRQELAQTVRKQQDLEAIPTNVQQNVDFQIAVLRYNPSSVNWFPQEYYKNNLQELITEVPVVFINLPSNLQTQELANVVAEHVTGYQALDRTVPKKFWTPEITNRYWTLRTQMDNGLMLSEVPEAFRTPAVIINCLARYADDTQRFTSLLTQEIAEELAKKNPKTIKHFPTGFLNGDIANILFKYAEGQHDTSLFQALAKFKPEFLTGEMIKKLIHLNINFPFADIPEDLRDDAMVIKYCSDIKRIKQVPTQYLTPTVMSTLIENSGHGEAFWQALPKDAVIDDAMILQAFKGSEYKMGLMWEHLPTKYKTRAVVQAFLDADAIPIKEIPHNLLTDEVVASRAASNPSEIKDILPGQMNYELALQLVQHSDKALEHLPAKVLTEPVLYAYLKRSDDRHHNYRTSKDMETQFNRFPKSVWSSRTVAAALRDNLIKAEVSEIPANLIDPEVAGIILAKNPKEIEKLNKPELLDDMGLAKAVVNNVNVLEKIPSDQMSEVIAFGAISKWAPYGMRDYYLKERKLLLDIPRKFWSYRVYKAAVGYIITLKDVPAKFRKDELILDAVKRNPNNVRYLPDAAAWLNANMANWSDSKADRKSNAKWWVGLEEAGVIKTKKTGFLNVSSLKREPVADGYTVGFVKAGPSNIRGYLFDPKDKYLTYFFTDGGHVHMPDVMKYESIRNVIYDLAKLYLKDQYNLSDLNQIGIYGTGNGRIKRAEESERVTVEGLEWSIETHRGNHLVTAWVNGKPIVKLELVAGGGGWGRRSTARMDGVEIPNIPSAVRNAPAIVSYIKTKLRDVQASWQLRRIGIVTDSKGANPIAIPTENVGTVGNLTVWRNAQFIGLFGKTGMLAYIILRKNGSYDMKDVQDHSLEKSLQKAFDAIVKALKVKPSGLKIDSEIKPETEQPQEN